MDFEETVDLPSMGLLAGSKESIQVRSMLVKDEKLIFRKGTTLGTKLLQFLTACTDVTDQKEALQLPLNDVLFAFLKVRHLSLGMSTHSFRVQCKVCDELSNVDVDLDQQDVKILSENCEPYEVYLPRVDKKVRLKYMRVKDQIQLDKTLQRRKADSDSALFLSERLSTVTFAVGSEENPPFGLLCQFYDNLTIRDRNVVLDAIDEYDFGIDLRALVECRSCGAVDEHLIVMDETFFRAPRRGHKEH